MLNDMKPLNPCDVALLNGPNLNLLGTREPEVYGADTLKSIEAKMMVQQMKSAGTTFLIINAAAYTHTSIAIRDAIAAVDVPFIEVHLSNIYKREQFRHHSYLSERAEAVICGFGAMGYDVALDYVIGKLRGSL